MENERELDQLQHVAINVADLAAATDWYRSSFVCKVHYQDRTRTVLEFANMWLVLVLPSDEPPHIAFPRSDAETLGELRDRPDGLRSTFIADPSGNLVEIIAK